MFRLAYASLIAACLILCVGAARVLALQNGLSCHGTVASTPAFQTSPFSITTCSGGCPAGPPPQFCVIYLFFGTFIDPQGRVFTAQQQCVCDPTPGSVPSGDETTPTSGSLCSLVIRERTTPGGSGQQSIGCRQVDCKAPCHLGTFTRGTGTASTASCKCPKP